MVASRRCEVPVDSGLDGRAKTNRSIKKRILLRRKKIRK
jgi:hypothetical protein